MKHTVAIRRHLHNPRAKGSLFLITSMLFVDIDYDPNPDEIRNILECYPGWKFVRKFPKKGNDESSQEDRT